LPKNSINSFLFCKKLEINNSYTNQFGFVDCNFESKASPGRISRGIISIPPDFLRTVEGLVALKITFLSLIEVRIKFKKSFDERYLQDYHLGQVVE